MFKHTFRCSIFCVLFLFTFLTARANEVNGKFADSTVVLVRNYEEELPIKELPQKITSLWVGELDNAHPFQQMLSRYTKVEHFFFHSKNKAYLASIKEKLTNSTDYLLVAIDSTATPTLLEEMQQWFTGLENLKVTYCFAAETPLRDMLTIPDEVSIFVAPQVKFGEVAQVIFGGLSCRGTLKQSYGQFIRGEGIPLSSLGRLSYISSDQLGIDSEKVDTAIDSVCNEAISLGAFPGCQVMGIFKGQVFFHKTYGFHTYQRKREVRHDDLYDLASVSKITTALPALMRFHGQGKFPLDKPLKTFFPYLKSSNKKNLIMREVLAHQAQLKAWIPYWQTTLNDDGSFKSKTLRKTYHKNYPHRLTDSLYLHKNYRKKIFKAIKQSPLLEKKEYLYSGLSFYLFPELVRCLAKTDFETHLKKTFYEPLGAYRLTYNPLRFWDKDKIIPTEKDSFFRQQQLHGVVHDEGAAMMHGISANAGLFGTADDLAKLLQMYLQKGEFAGQQFIAKESMEEFTRYQFPNNRRGLGFDKPLLENKENGSVSVLASEESFGHSGYTGTFVWVDPAYDFVFIFLSNRVYPTRDNRLIYQYNIRPTLSHIFYEALKAKIDD